ncbi:MAG: biotin attachment protein [Candidatus Cloacimonetes bacterium]|nr:biotin attachment protein [Candidatus Cloacimonadota bacterium]
MKKIRFMDTSFRDGFQSVFGARVKTKDFLPAIQASVSAGIKHFEFGGGARFQSLFFYCQESAFDMMDQVRLTVGPDINLQTLSRGINVVGLSQQPRDIIKMHAELFRKHGTTTIRNFDALNDMNNLDYSGRSINEAGLKHQITITLMGLPPGVKDRSVHTAEFYMEKLNDILRLDIPFSSIVFKDASGTCPPEIVYETVKKARKKVGSKVTLWFHTHDTAGLGIICYMAAIRAGIDGIDLAQSPVSSGTGQPDILSMWHSLRNSGYSLDIDYEKILESERIFEESMSRYMIPPEAKRTSPNIVLSPMPGGALTANTMMMRDSNTLHLYPKVIEEMANVISKGGYGTSVTPVSQFYFQQSFMNVVQGQWKRIADGYGNMVLGYFGKTPRKPDPEIVELASSQLKKEPFDGNPVDILEPGIPSAKEMLAEQGLPLSPENIFIVATCKNKGVDFLKGNAPLAIYYKDEAKPAVPGSLPKTEKSMQPITLKLDAPYIETAKLAQVLKGIPGIQIIESQTDSHTKHPVHKTSGKTVKHTGLTKEVIAPQPGRIRKILKANGNRVEEDEIVLHLIFMDIEHDIPACFSGHIDKIMVSEGDFIKSGQLLFTIK